MSVGLPVTPITMGKVATPLLIEAIVLIDATVPIDEVVAPVGTI